MIYYAVEYSLGNLLPVAKNGEVVAHPIGEFADDIAATAAAAGLLKCTVKQTNYIGRKDTRFTIFTETEFHQLLEEIEANKC